MQITKRPWNLRKSQRVLIVLCAGLYVLAFHPWSHVATDGTGSVYAGAAAMLVLAALPPRVRLLAALSFAIVVAFFVYFGLLVFGMQGR